MRIQPPLHACVESASFGVPRLVMSWNRRLTWRRVKSGVVGETTGRLLKGQGQDGSGPGSLVSFVCFRAWPW